MCQRSKGVQFFQVHLPKGVPIFRLFFKRIFQFLNFSIMLIISKFQNIWTILKKLIWRNKESKFLHFQNLIKENPCQPKTFEVVLNRARGINRIIIRLV